MKTKYIFIITFSIFVILLGIGLLNKSTFKDFNKEDAPLDKFEIGILSDKSLNIQLEMMDKKLDKSKIIIAAKCKSNIRFSFSSIMQDVTIEHVFKGDDLNVGDTITIVNGGDLISMSKELNILDDMYSINLGFVNELIPGNTYLIFINDVVHALKKQTLYVVNREFYLSPIFCYQPIESIPLKSVDENSNVIPYKDAKENEFFLMSEEGIEKLTAYKQKLFKKYPYH